MGFSEKKCNTTKSRKLNPNKPQTKSNKEVIKMKGLKCVTWNIRRGLVTREKELQLLLSEEDIDVAFLTETDTTALRKEENYQIPGYKTIFPKRSKENAKIRIIALIIHLSGI